MCRNISKARRRAYFRRKYRAMNHISATRPNIMNSPTRLRLSRCRILKRRLVPKSVRILSNNHIRRHSRNSSTNSVATLRAITTTTNTREH